MTTQPKYHQIGKSDTIADYARDALSPGRRISKDKKVYYENRKNRSDMPHKRI